MIPPKITFVSSHARVGGSERYLVRVIASLRFGRVAEVICLESGPLIGVLREERLDPRVIPTGARAWDIAISAVRLARRLHKTRPDLVHANGIKAGVVAALATVLTPVPLLWVRHDFTWGGSVSRFVAWRSRVVVGVSEAVLRELPGHRAPHKYMVIHNGVPPFATDRRADARHLRSLIGASDDVPVVLLVGRLHPLKGYLDAIQAAHVAAAHRDVQFVFVGGEDPSAAGFPETLLARIEAAGMSRVVRMLGHRDDARRLISGADVLVVASRRARGAAGNEGGSIVALEAMMVGTPVLAYRDGGLPELLGPCGILVPPGDPAALGEAVVRLLDDRRALDRAGRCVRQRAEAEFSEEQMFDLLAVAYRRTLRR